MVDALVSLGSALLVLNYFEFFAVLNYFEFFAPNTHCALVVALSEKKKVPFSMAIGNEARVFSQTIAHWNNKNEIRRKNKKKVRREA